MKHYGGQIGLKNSLYLAEMIVFVVVERRLLLVPVQDKIRPLQRILQEKTGGWKA